MQKLHRIDSEGVSILNEQDCPLLELATNSQIIPSRAVTESVSIVHECDLLCHFKNHRITVQIEREEVASTRLTYVHNYNNRFFCLNIYSM